MTAHIHAALAAHVPASGACKWAHHSHGQDLWCDERAIPGDPPLCADHTIAWAVARTPPVRWGSAA